MCNRRYLFTYFFFPSVYFKILSLLPFLCSFTVICGFATSSANCAQLGLQTAESWTACQRTIAKEKTICLIYLRLVMFSIDICMYVEV